MLVLSFPCIISARFQLFPHADHSLVSSADEQLPSAARAADDVCLVSVSSFPCFLRCCCCCCCCCRYCSLQPDALPPRLLQLDCLHTCMGRRLQDRHHLSVLVSRFKSRAANTGRPVRQDVRRAAAAAVHPSLRQPFSTAPLSFYCRKQSL